MARRNFCGRQRIVRRYGAAVIVMAFDEAGQADTLQRRIDVCARAYKLLTESRRPRRLTTSFLIRTS